MPTSSQTFVQVSTLPLIPTGMEFDITNQGICTNGPPYMTGYPIIPVNPALPFAYEYDFSLEASLKFDSGQNFGNAPSDGVWSVVTSVDTAATCKDNSENFSLDPAGSGSMAGSASTSFIPDSLQIPNPNQPLFTSVFLTTAFPQSNYSSKISNSEDLSFSEPLSQSDWQKEYNKLGQFDGYYTATFTSAMMTTKTVGSVTFPANIYTGSFSESTAEFKLVESALRYSAL